MCTLPRRCLHGVHLAADVVSRETNNFASALPARSASLSRPYRPRYGGTLPRRCLHGVHLKEMGYSATSFPFASALPARSASIFKRLVDKWLELCLGAACTECIGSWTTTLLPDLSLPRRCLHGVHLSPPKRLWVIWDSLPRRCLHGVHR